MTIELHPEATACGKVILVGEHAAVYGIPALAAGLPDSLRLRAQRAAHPRAPIHLHLPAWDLDLHLDPDDDHPVGRACLEVLGWCDGPLTGWTITGDTTLPARGGLGSSAALTVALARLVLGPDAPASDLVEASLAGERVFHGEPSGIDSEVAARGGVLRFVRGEGVEEIRFPGRLPLVIVPSGIPRNTADQVRKVRERHDRCPSVVRPILQAVGAATGAAISAIQAANLTQLGEIMDINHGLLAALGVSSPALDELCAVARHHDAFGAKLTGAGGGGCIVAVPPPDPAPLVEAFAARSLSPLLVHVTS